MRRDATPWALDEFDMPEIFAAIARFDDTTAPAEAAEPVENLASPQERARIEAAAYARGYSDGERVVRAELTERLESAVNALTDALESVRLHQARWMANVEENIAVVAVVAARHLIAREVEADATIVSGLVQRALAQFPLDHRITVRLNPGRTAHPSRSATRR
jgi:flagellar assembly protein FliH